MSAYTDEDMRNAYNAGKADGQREEYRRMCEIQTHEMDYLRRAHEELLEHVAKLLPFPTGVIVTEKK
jgi:hypothetical protein